MSTRSNAFDTKVLDALAKHHKTGLTVPQLASALGMKLIAMAKLHPILARFERDGLVESRWEDAKFPSEGGRDTPAATEVARERFYRLTPTRNGDTF